MATGKSTVGRLIAQRAGCAFVDLDERIEARAGLKISELFAQRGEPAFRQLEAEALEEVLEAGRREVVALGGGALLVRARRLKALDRAVVIGLSADVDETLRRAAAQPGQRPLLAAGSAAEHVEQLLEERANAYAECHARLDTTGRTPEELAARAFELWQRDGVAVGAGEHSYSVEIGAGFASQRLPEWTRGRSRILLISDRNVAPLHAARVREALGGSEVELIELPAGEMFKTLATVESIWKRASTLGADRSSLFVGLGGGVVTDITGYAAASWMRGVPWLALPTTLLSMVDASVGGKTAVDLGQAKNCVGAFWQPSAVFCDVDYCATEPNRGLTALSEVVKTALIGDPGMLELVEQKAASVLRRERDVTAEIVRRSIRVKARVVGQDAREQGIRAALNLGHTFGHALEAAAGFDRLSHGEAISLGLVAALRLGQRLAVTSEPLVARVTRLLARLGLPTNLRDEPLEQAAELLQLDKKRKGKRIKFVLVREPGQIEFRSLEIGELVRLSGDLARMD